MKKIFLILMCIAIFTLSGCSGSSTTKPNSQASTPSSKASTTNTSYSKDYNTMVAIPKENVTTKDVVDILQKKESKYMTNITLVKASNDPDKLLGHLHEYIDEVTFDDSRAKNTGIDCSVKLFMNKEDASAEKTSKEDQIKSKRMPSIYIEQNNNFVLELTGTLTSEQANEYIDTFKAIQFK